MPKRTILAVVIGIIILAALVPVGYGLAQRATISSLKFHFNSAELANVKMKRGIIRSGIILKMRFLSDDVEVDNFPKDVGEKIFRLVQDGVAGRLTLAQPADAVVKTPNAMQQEIIEKIKELAKLKDQGILSDIEFQTKKSELLARL